MPGDANEKRRKMTDESGAETLEWDREVLNNRKYRLWTARDLEALDFLHSGLW
jgi:hypothetical protein